MDDIDLAILRILQQDARTSLKEISANVNLSTPATGERLKKLERSGYVKGYTALLNPEKFGKLFGCFCFIILGSSNSHNDVAFLSYVKDTPDILECHRITGVYEYVLKIVTRSPKSLESILKILREKWGPTKTSTFTILSSLKELPSVAPAHIPYD